MPTRVNCSAATVAAIGSLSTSTPLQSKMTTEILRRTGQSAPRWYHPLFWRITWSSIGNHAETATEHCGMQRNAQGNRVKKGVTKG
jgi:hypothetical protein